MGSIDLTLVDIGVAIAIAVFSFFGGRSAERRQYRLSATSFATDYFRDLRAWASDAIDVLSESSYLAPGRSDSNNIDPGSCVRCRHSLSALIDKGRFFLPNFNPDDIGTEKPAAFRGLRHPALDILVSAEQLLANPDLAKQMRFPSQRAALVDLKREFVSEIQEILDPRTQNKELAELIRSTRRDPNDKRSALERLGQREHPDLHR